MRYAPEILLVECTNTIWKKTRRREIANPPPYRLELASLPDVLAFTADGDLSERGTKIAFDIDQPIHDCLDVVCAEAASSDLITADSRLARKAAVRHPEPRIHDIATPGVAEWIETAGNAPVPEYQNPKDLSQAYEVCAHTKQLVSESLPGRPPGIAVTTIDDSLGQGLDSPDERRLANLISKLNDEALIDLLACGWFGAGFFPSWRRRYRVRGKEGCLFGASLCRRLRPPLAGRYARALDAVQAAQLEELT